MAKKVELPRKEGVRPASKDIKRFLKRLKNCTTANREASAPTIRFIFNSLSQLSFLINKAAKIGKIKINKRFSNPPVLVGNPKMLSLMFSENIVDATNVSKKPESARNGKNARLFTLGKEIEISFFTKNLKPTKTTKAVKISLNKIMRLQSDG